MAAALGHVAAVEGPMRRVPLKIGGSFPIS